MTEKQLESITEAVKKGMESTLKDLYVEREKHYQDHLFVGSVRKGLGKARAGGLITLGAMSVGGLFWAIKSWIASISGGGTP